MEKYHQSMTMIHICDGYVGINNTNNLDEITTPSDLAHGGEHFEGLHCHIARVQQEESQPIVLPRSVLFKMIVDGHWE